MQSDTMRNISTSTAVFAAIWAARKPGEENEDAILRRILKVTESEEPAVKTGGVGFSDPRFDVQLPEGFEIFRTYLGTEYRAKATGGSWMLMNTGQSYPSLNQLSSAIGTKTENAWINWYYMDTHGKRRLVNELRRT